MRQSLSVSTRADARSSATTNRRAATAAVSSAIALFGVLAGAAIADQVGVHSLSEHAIALYEPYGVVPDPTLLYGALYAVAALGAMLWLLVLAVVRAQRRFAAVLAGVVATVTAALALVLLTATEYGVAIFPPLWGVLALLPTLAGALAVVPLVRRQRPGQRGGGRHGT